MQAKPEHRAGHVMSIEVTLAFLLIVIFSALCPFSFALVTSSILLPE